MQTQFERENTRTYPEGYRLLCPSEPFNKNIWVFRGAPNSKIRSVDFTAETWEEAEALAHLLHAASQGLPKVKMLLDDVQEFVVTGYCDRTDMNKHLIDVEAELGFTANRNPPKEELGGAG